VATCPSSLDGFAASGDATLAAFDVNGEYETGIGIDRDNAQCLFRQTGIDDLAAEAW